MVNELFSGANLSLSLLSLLTTGTAHLVEAFGSAELKALVCEKMYSGQWGGTMCLTEPQAGSDVGASTAKAEKQADGSYLISGEKIFITYGEHDLTENIIHAVLARTPDTPAGTRGLSLFIVPKFRVTASGGIGEPNDVRCAGIEHKLGIHASPTCSMVFGREGACQGFLLSEECEGMRLMFQMMNEARIEVGLQATAVAGAAHQAALKYAKERLQMRHWQGGGPRQVPIIEHPDVRRMLLTSSAYVQAMRAILLKTSYFIDMSRVSEGADKARYQALVELLTPVCKAWPSDWGFRVTEWCLQVFGGYGYTKDYPAEHTCATPRSPRSTKAPTASRPSTSWPASCPRAAARRCARCWRRRRRQRGSSPTTTGSASRRACWARPSSRSARSSPRSRGATTDGWSWCSTRCRWPTSSAPCSAPNSCSNKPPSPKASSPLCWRKSRSTRATAKPAGRFLRPTPPPRFFTTRCSRRCISASARCRRLPPTAWRSRPGRGRR